MGIITFLKKDSEGGCQCEICKLSQYIVLDEEGNAQLGLEVILKNDSEHMSISGIRIVLDNKMDNERKIVEKSETLLDRYSPWNTRYSEGYSCINEKEGELIVDGLRCYAIGFETSVNDSYKGINILDINFKAREQKCRDCIDPETRGAFRIIIPFKKYAYNRGDTWFSKTFLNWLVGIPHDFKNNLERNINQTIKIKKNPCDIHVILPPHMILRSIVPMHVDVAFRGYELFDAKESNLEQEGMLWRARHFIDKAEEYLEISDIDGQLSWDGMSCNFSYWRPITREWLREVIRDETKKALGEYMNEKFSKLFK